MRVPLKPAHWQLAYDGGGQVSFEGKTLRFRPGFVQRDQDTKAALLLLDETSIAADGIQIRFRVLRQLRSNPRPWEVFWLFFGYRQGAEIRSKTTDYFILKTNGIEIGKAFEELEQKFLLTKDTPKLFVGRSYVIRLQREDGLTRFIVDGVSVAQTPGDFKSSALFSGGDSRRGSFGLYAEDAEIEIESVELLQRISQ